MLKTHYIEYIREYQGRVHHLTSRKSTKQISVNGTKQKTFQYFSKRIVMLKTTMNVYLRMIISTGVHIHMIL